MKINTQIIICSFIYIFWTNQVFSQSPYIYNFPNAPHSLKLQNKGDLVFSIGAFSKNDSEHVGNGFLISPGASYFYKYQKTSSNFQLGYSVINRLALSLNYDRIKTKDTGTQNTYNTFHTSHLTGLGIGTYHKFKSVKWIVIEKKNKKIPKYIDILFDFYLGYGKGKINNDYFLYEVGDVELSFQKYYLQGGIHLLGKNFDWSYLLKFGEIQYLKGFLNGVQDITDKRTLDSITDISNFIFWESTLKAEYKTKYFGVFGQITFSSNHEFSQNQLTTNVFQLGVSSRLQNVNFKKRIDSK